VPSEYFDIPFRKKNGLFWRESTQKKNPLKSRGHVREEDRQTAVKTSGERPDGVLLQYASIAPAGAIVALRKNGGTSHKARGASYSETPRDLHQHLFTVQISVLRCFVVKPAYVWPLSEQVNLL